MLAIFVLCIAERPVQSVLLTECRYSPPCQSSKLSLFLYVQSGRFSITSVEGEASISMVLHERMICRQYPCLCFGKFQFPQNANRECCFAPTILRIIMETSGSLQAAIDEPLHQHAIVAVGEFFKLPDSRCEKLDFVCHVPELHLGLVHVVHRLQHNVALA